MNSTGDVASTFLTRAGLSEEASLRDIVEAIRQIPHGRPGDRSAAGVVGDWRGTCSTKHLLLDALRPDLELRFFHRVFLLTPKAAEEKLGPEVAAIVPEEGMIDIHTYATGLVDGSRVVFDVTFPGRLWDGHSDMAVAFPPGDDFDGGFDPIASKEALAERFCDPVLRTRLVAAIT